MVTRGAILENLQKLDEMEGYIQMLKNLHQTALFSWNIEGDKHYLPQDDIDALIARYQDLKGSLETKYEELL